MSTPIITVDHLSKRYRLGTIGATTLRESAERAWHRIRGRDPDEHMGTVGGQRNNRTEGQRDRGTEGQCKQSNSPTPVTLSPCNSVPPETLSPCNSSSDLWALKDVSFEVQPGEVLGIIGRNGAGKSTLLKILTRITEPTSGRAILRGRVASLLEVGTGFHPELTGRENIYLNGAILGMRRGEIARKFDEIVAFAEVDRFIDTPVKRYSSGMYVRLAFAVAAHLEPEILLVDEVLAVGDMAFQRKCLGKMGEVAKGGRTVLFVSHNMAAVRKLCSHAILLNQGRLCGQGQTDEVVDEYTSQQLHVMTPVIGLPAGTPEAPGAATLLRFQRNGGGPCTEFRLGESWVVTVEFHMRTHTRHVIAGVGLSTAEGVPVTTYWSRPADLPPGDYRVTFAVALPLQSCDLEFSVGLSTFERPFYFVTRVGHVAISSVAFGEQPFREAGCGLLLSSDRPNIQPCREDR